MPRSPRRFPRTQVAVAADVEEQRQHLEQPGRHPQARREADRAGRMGSVVFPDDDGEDPVPGDDDEQAERADEIDEPITPRRPAGGGRRRGRARHRQHLDQPGAAGLGIPPVQRGADRAARPPRPARGDRPRDGLHGVVERVPLGRRRRPRHAGDLPRRRRARRRSTTSSRTAASTTACGRCCTTRWCASRSARCCSRRSPSVACCRRCWPCRGGASGPTCWPRCCSGSGTSCRRGASVTSTRWPTRCSATAWPARWPASRSPSPGRSSPGCGCRSCGRSGSILAPMMAHVATNSFGYAIAWVVTS